MHQCMSDAGRSLTCPLNLVSSWLQARKLTVEEMQAVVAFLEGSGFVKEDIVRVSTPYPCTVSLPKCLETLASYSLSLSRHPAAHSGVSPGAVLPA